ncbi:MAG: class III lanthionine synthetase LanKC [Canibacter sp.]
MDPEYEEFLEHPQFFVKPGTLRPDDGAFDSSVPHEWIVERGDEWTYLMPPNSSTPTQGWKIHVSTTMAEASEVLAIVATLCVDRGIAFKHLKSPARLFWRNSKSCAREHSGKFVACYPHDDEAAELASALDAALAGRRGPYILSDRRWASAPVYIRYGAFKFIPLPDGDGSASALARPDGTLVPDVRGAVFSVPDWVEVPATLQQWLAESEDADTTVLPVEITGAIKFSNSGGTYRGTPTNDQARALVVKEGRPLAGLDLELADAVDRITHEAEVLDALRAIEGIPGVFWTGTAWEHTFLAMDQIPGQPLNRWVTSHAPGYTFDGAQLQEYFTSAGTILQRIINMVTAIHEYGWAHQDLHPDNVMVDDDLAVGLIDFEVAVPVSTSVRTQIMGAPGFRSRQRRTPEQIDLFALRQIGSYLMTPLITQTELVDDYVMQVRSFAWSRYGANSDAETSLAVRSYLDLLESLDALVVQPTANQRPYAVPVIDIAAWPAGDSPLPDEDPSAWWRDRTARGLATLKSSYANDERSYPVHIYGLDQRNRGIAFGDLAVEAALPPELRSPGLEALAQELLLNPWDHGMDLGLFTGATGDLLSAQRLGLNEIVAAAIEENENRLYSSEGTRAYDGRPGVLLGLLKSLPSHGSEGPGGTPARLVDAVIGTAREYLRSPQNYAPLGADRPSRSNSPAVQDSGLLYGHLGIAWLMAEAYQHIPDDLLLDAANQALNNELTGYINDERYGTLQSAQGHRQLPYLSMGSAGFGVVLPKIPRDAVDGAVIDAVPQLLKATIATVCVCPGLFNGYSGLALGRSGMQTFLELETYDPRDLSDVLKAFAMQTADGAALFAGDSGLRLTADVASGSAGILLALETLQAGATDPFGSTASIRPTYHENKRR